MVSGLIIPLLPLNTHSTYNANQDIFKEFTNYGNNNSKITLSNTFTHTRNRALELFNSKLECFHIRHANEITFMFHGMRREN